MSKYPIHKDEKGRWVHTWVRQSAIKTADMCLERFRTDIFNVHPPLEKDAAALGTACHQAAEDVLNAKVDGIAEMSESDAVAAFMYAWSEAIDNIDAWESYTVEEATEIGAEKVTSWYREVYPELKPLFVEKHFDVMLHEDDERVVRLSGTIDLVERDRLWDWKFPKRDYSREKWQYERWDIQSIAYCYALGIPNFSYRIMHPKGVGHIDLERNQTHFDWLRTKVLALCHVVESQTPAPWVLGDNGWWCSEKWCDNWSHCKGR